MFLQRVSLKERGTGTTSLTVVAATLLTPISQRRGEIFMRNFDILAHKLPWQQRESCSLALIFTVLNVLSLGFLAI